MKNIIIAAGGTGGHISPGIALAEELETRKAELGIASLYFHVPERNRSYPDLLDFKWKILWHNTPQPSGNIIKTAIQYLVSILSSMRTLRRFKIDTVIAMGGYSSLPAIMYAIFLKKAIFICEQNTRVGKVNRFIMRFARKTALSFPLAANEAWPAEYKITGNPLRKKITDHIGKKTNKTKTRLNILVMGGSQGARQINKMAADILLNDPVAKKLNFRIISGAGLYEEVMNDTGGKAEVIQYSEKMEDHYQWADLVVARSGAGVIAELAAYGLPAVLIPYPYAADNHQKTNADYFAGEGAAWIIDSKEESSGTLSGILNSILAGKKELQTKSVKMQALARPFAARDTADYFFKQ